jgi:hypothetical protein
MVEVLVISGREESNEVVATLEYSGLTFRHVHTVTEAIALARDEAPKFILLDADPASSDVHELQLLCADAEFWFLVDARHNPDAHHSGVHHIHIPLVGLELRELFEQLIQRSRGASMDNPDGTE